MHLHNALPSQRAAQIILFAKDMVNNRVINELKDELDRKCEAETFEANCLEVARIGNRAACTWTPGRPDHECHRTEIPESSINQWLEWTMFALFGLAFGQLIRLLSSHIFRRATRDQVCVCRARACVCVCVCRTFSLPRASHAKLISPHEQVDIASFEDPFLANDSYDRWSKYSASYRDPDRVAGSRRDRYGN